VTPPSYLAELPENQVKDIKNALFAQIFFNFRIIWKNTDFKYDICGHLQPREFLPEQDILQQGEKGEEILLFEN
jgi:hypothetical protein